jgi:hypothetical protein
MDHPGPYPFGHSGHAQYRPPVIVKFDHVSVLDAPGFGVHGMDANRLPAVTLFRDPMTRNIIQPRDMTIVMGMERKSGMGRNHLQRILTGKLGLVSLPAGDVASHGRPLRVIG